MANTCSAMKLHLYEGKARKTFSTSLSEIDLSSPGRRRDLKTIRRDTLYVYAFGNSRPQFNSQGSIDVDLLNVIRTRSSYSQFGWAVQFLQNLLAWSVVILTSLPIGTVQVIIDALLLMLSDCLSIGN